VDDPDVYDINVIAWDYGLSPLHLAILNGHLHIIELLVSEYGADVLLPVKLVQPGSRNARGAIMTLVLAMSLPNDKAKETIKLLLSLGATSAQADMNRFTAFHYIVAEDNSTLLDVLLADDRPSAMSILNNLGHSGHWGYQIDSPLTTAVKKGYHDMTMKLLKLGAKPEVRFWFGIHYETVLTLHSPGNF
jgi:ankyrin repeat protein